MLHVYAVQGSLNLYTNTIVQSRVYFSSLCNTFGSRLALFPSFLVALDFFEIKETFCARTRHLGLMHFCARQSLNHGMVKTSFIFTFLSLFVDFLFK